MTTRQRLPLHPISDDANAPWCAYIYDPSAQKFVRSYA